MPSTDLYYGLTEDLWNAYDIRALSDPTAVKVHIRGVDADDDTVARFCWVSEVVPNDDDLGYYVSCDAEDFSRLKCFLKVHCNQEIIDEAGILCTRPIDDSKPE